MLRVSVVGTSCSGKTTLAKRISSACNIPHVELDLIHWLPNWTPRPIDEFREAVRAAASADKWVIDGNYSKVRDLTWPRATDVVWLNLPFSTVFRRALTRTAKRILTGEEVFPGSRETIKLMLFNRDSIVWWVIRTHRRRQRAYQKLFRDTHSLQFLVHEIRKSEDVAAALRKLCDAG